MEDKAKDMIGETPHAEAPDEEVPTVCSVVGNMPKGQPHASKETKPDPPPDLKEILGDMPVGVPFKLPLQP